MPLEVTAILDPVWSLWKRLHHSSLWIISWRWWWCWWRGRYLGRRECWCRKISGHRSWHHWQHLVPFVTCSNTRSLSAMLRATLVPLNTFLTLFKVSIILCLIQLRLIHSSLSVNVRNRSLHRSNFREAIVSVLCAVFCKMAAGHAQDSVYEQ